ncbi:DUF6049 family protein [Nocardiopsis sp. CNT-189]|uniref:DUF6049 family protein n=1 Tax=Nocardiopsis oceanisediminis TaxID=2816862 RepID=UPI003B3A377F
MRRFAHLGAVVATTAILIPALAAFSPVRTPSAAPAETDPDEAPLVIDAITPEAVEPDSTLRITGEITNTTGAALDDLAIRFRYSGYPFHQRAQLAEFGEGRGDGQTPARGPSVDVDAPLEPGESAAFTLKVKAGKLGLDGFGVYPMAVEALEGGSEIATVRSFLPYEGEKAPSPVDMAWVWPLMDYPRRTDDDTFLSTDLAASVGPNGRLGRLLAAGAQDDSLTLDPGEAADPQETPEPEESESARDTTSAPASDGADRVPVTWAVDPGLLSDIERLAAGPHQVLEDPAAAGDALEPPAQTHEADPAARVWLDGAASALESGHVIATPYANPDVSALLAADLGADLDASVSLGRDALASALGIEADGAYALPPGGLVDKATLDFYAEQGATRFLVSDTQMPRRPWVEHTPDAGAELPAGGSGESTALVVDSGITDALGQPSRDPGEAALARQRFIAETAMISGEHTGGDRTVVAMPPATWNPDPEFARSALAASEELPWVDAVELGDVEPPSGDPERQEPSGGAVKKARLDGDHLDAVKDIRGSVRLFNSILVEDVDPFRTAVLRAESAAWREEESRRPLSVRLVGSAVQAGLGKVRIIPTEPVTLASKTGTIGVIIANDLEDEDLAVQVKLSMFSENPERMSIGDYTDEMEIGPGRKTTVYVPLNARINGRTMLYLSLQNSMGEPVSSEETLTSVNATGLGNQAMIISGIGALVLVVALTPRALRKWARKRAAAQGGPAGGEDG